MRTYSAEGVKLLRALALAVRSEQDFDLAPNPAHIVGVLKRTAVTPTDAEHVKRHFGFRSMLQEPGFTPLNLRQALNKIAHADPTAADYYVGPGHRSHDLLLYGEERGERWFAAVSILELVEAIRGLPDATLRS